MAEVVSPKRDQGSVPSDSEVLAVPNIKETDWTERSFSEVCVGLTDRLVAGFLLHGSPDGALTQLQPKMSVDFTPYKQGEVTAVFATDMPLAPVFRAVYGQHLTSWAKSVLFTVADKQIAENSIGGISMYVTKMTLCLMQRTEQSISRKR